MQSHDFDVVTGAFSFTGKYITQRLLSMGRAVKTLTGHPDRPHPFGGQIAIAALNFNDPLALVASLRGASTLYNTYWVRFSHGLATFEKAIANTRTLSRAAEEAGVRRIVHISVTKASEISPLPYFRGKGILERVIAESNLAYTIIRPTVIYGSGDILINNIAWLLRRAPVFAIPGSGEYRLQPVSVEDVAALAVSAAHRGGNVVMDAAGPEIYTFDQLVRLIGRTIRSRARIVHVRPGLAVLLTKVLGYLVNDVVLTTDEVRGLMANLLLPDGSPTAAGRLSVWLSQNADNVGTRYASELGRHFR